VAHFTCQESDRENVQFDSAHGGTCGLASREKQTQNRASNNEVHMKSLFAITLFLATVLCAQAYNTTTPGPSVAVGNGLARSYITRDSQGKPLELGFWLEAKALAGLPDTYAIYLIPLPPGLTLPPYNHLTLDWYHHGHIPDGVYNVPHFDFHFFLITPEEREKIPCDNTDTALCMKTPDSDKIPANYVGAPKGTPKMGWHWIDATSPEFQGQPFTATFLYGYYNGEMIFFEPMVSLDYLTPQLNFEKEVPVPKRVSVKGYYPSKYSVFYLAPLDSYWITLKELVWKD